jgi:serine/threonine protein kinase/WD40 repeat protein
MPHTSDTRESVWVEHESVIRRFEDAWAGGRPDLAAHLPAGVRDRGGLIVELIQIDLEFRFRAGERPRVEEYLSHFPEQPAGPVLAELIGGELALRDRHGQPYTEDELRGRFPQLATRLDTLMVSGSNRGRTRTPQGGAGRWVTAKPVLPGYEVGDPLGRGGMGVVYQAEQATPARTVAVKTLLAVPNDRGAARFRREAEAMARLDHPHIVPVYEVGEWTAGGATLPYFTMKWYPGGSLDELAARPGTPVAEHARLVEQVARAVHHAHQRGVLHRDLKPSNILLDADGRPAVADFGLAGRFDPDDPAPMSETVVGTPAFMAPEQARDPAGVTTAADVYGLGAILYHQLTGRPPVQAATAVAAFEQLATSRPPPPSAVNPAVPRDLETVCLKCLEADPRNRYPSAEAVADDLARWRAGKSIVARPPGFAERVWRAVRRHPVITALIFATAAALLVSLVTLSVSVHNIRLKEAETSAALDREKVAVSTERRALYLERVASAGRLYLSNHTEQAWYTLGECPPELRRWEWHYLDRLRQASGGRLLRHPDAVSSAAFLADGRIVSADRRKGVYVWQGDKPVPLAARGTVVRPHPTRPVVAVQNGTECAVIDLDSGKVLLEPPAEGWVDFSPDGGWLAAGDGRVVRVYDTTRWQPAGELRGHSGPVWCGVFSPDGGTVYTGSADMTIGVWDWKGRKLRDRWERKLALLHLTMSADGKTLFETHAGQLWVTDTDGNTRRLTDVSGPRPPFLPTAFPGLYLTTGQSDEVQLRTIDPGEPVRVFRGHTGALYTVSVSPDGRRALTGGEDGTARVWDLSATPEYAEPAGGLTKAAPVLSADGRRVALVCRDLYGTRDEPLPVLDALGGRELYRTKGAGDADFDPHGRWLAVGRLNGDVALLDADTGAERRVLSASGHTPVQVRFSRDGRRLAASGTAGPVRVWDTGTWERTDFTGTGDQFVRALAWSPDGTQLALAVGDEVWMWDPATGEVGAKLRPAGVPLVCAFTPDGKRLAVAGRGRALELFELDSYRTLTFIGNPSVVNGLAFDPTGTRLASVGENGLARLWDTASGKEVLTLNGGAELHGVAWSPDGKHLYASGSTLRRWSSGE